jgi:predicted secreted protein
MSDDGAPKQTTKIEQFDVHGLAGQAVILPIALGPATGHVWQLELPEGVSRIDNGPSTKVESAGEIGSGRGAHLRVTAPRGDHVIMARLARPWELGQPVRVVRIRLHID